MYIFSNKKCVSCKYFTLVIAQYGKDGKFYTNIRLKRDYHYTSELMPNWHFTLSHSFDTTVRLYLAKFRKPWRQFCMSIFGMWVYLKQRIICFRCIPLLIIFSSFHVYFTPDLSKS